MLRVFRPKQIIEVGSGWSSALMLDVNQLYSESATKLTFIDPYPERLHGALQTGDKKNTAPSLPEEPSRYPLIA